MSLGRVKTEQKILMVTGKGGVGKSMVAAAWASKLASQGFRTLLVELGEASFYQHIFQLQPTFKPRNLRDNLDLALWDGENCLKEYLSYLIKISAVVNLFFENRVMKTLIQAAPALKELAILGKLTSGLRGVGPELDYDCIVVDAYATGHFKALMNAPIGMGEAIKVGPMGEQSQAIRKVIKNPQLTKICIVSLPEELPVNESVELYDFLKYEFSQQPTLVLNRLLPIPLDEEQLQKLTEELEQLPDTDRSVISFVNHIRRVNQRQRRYIDQLSQISGESVETLPHLLRPAEIGFIEELAQHLESPWPQS